MQNNRIKGCEWYMYKSCDKHFCTSKMDVKALCQDLDNRYEYPWDLQSPPPKHPQLHPWPLSQHSTCYPPFTPFPSGLTMHNRSRSSLVASGGDLPTPPFPPSPPLPQHLQWWKTVKNSEKQKIMPQSPKTLKKINSRPQRDNGCTLPCSEWGLPLQSN